MALYWVIVIVVIVSLSVIFLCSKFAVELKHLYDEEYRPSYHINEAEVLLSGVLLGSLGLLLSYFIFEGIRKNDSLNNHRFLWITLAELAAHIVLIVLLAYFGYLTLEGF